MTTVTEERRNRLRAIADAHDEWAPQNLDAPFDESQARGDKSVYNQHYADLDASGAAQDEYANQVAAITGGDQTASITDKRGNLHSEADGKFVRKGSAATRALKSGQPDSLAGFSREQLQREVRRRNREGAGIKLRRGATVDEIKAALHENEGRQGVPDFSGMPEQETVGWFNSLNGSQWSQMSADERGAARSEAQRMFEAGEKRPAAAVQKLDLNRTGKVAGGTETAVRGDRRSASAGTATERIRELQQQISAAPEGDRSTEEGARERVAEMLEGLTKPQLAKVAQDLGVVLIPGQRKEQQVRSIVQFTVGTLLDRRGITRGISGQASAASGGERDYPGKGLTGEQRIGQGQDFNTMYEGDAARERRLAREAREREGTEPQPRATRGSANAQSAAEKINDIRAAISRTSPGDRSAETGAKEQARAALDGLKKDELREVARQLDVPTGSSQTKAQLIRSIVDIKIGSVILSRSIERPNSAMGRGSQTAAISDDTDGDLFDAAFEAGLTAAMELGDDATEDEFAAEFMAEFASRMPEHLAEYWTQGPGAARVRWFARGAFRRCRRILRSEGVPGRMLDGACANLYYRATGRRSGRRKGATQTAAAETAEDAFSVEELEEFIAILNQEMEMMDVDAGTQTACGCGGGMVPVMAYDTGDDCPEGSHRMPDGSCMDDDTMAEMAADEVWLWEGPLAPIATPTNDQVARQFAPGALSSRSLPRPLRWQERQERGHDGAVVVGALVDYRLKDGRPFGKAYFFDDQIIPEAGRARYLVEHGVIAPSVDLEPSMEVAYADADGNVFSPDTCSADGTCPANPMQLITRGTIAASTLVPIAAFGELGAGRLYRGPKPAARDYSGTQVAAVRSSGWDDMPIASRDRDWDKDAADRRVSQWASTDGDIDWSKYGRAFLWHDDPTSSQTASAAPGTISEWTEQSALADVISPLREDAHVSTLPSSIRVTSDSGEKADSLLHPVASGAGRNSYAAMPSDARNVVAEKAYGKHLNELSGLPKTIQNSLANGISTADSGAHTESHTLNSCGCSTTQAASALSAVEGSSLKPEKETLREHASITAMTRESFGASSAMHATKGSASSQIASNGLSPQFATSGPTKSDFKFPIADIVDGELAIIPRAVFAAAARLGQADIPADAQDGLRDVISDLYDQMAEEFDDDDIIAPWDDDREEMSVQGCGCAAKMGAVKPGTQTASAECTSCGSKYGVFGNLEPYPADAFGPVRFDQLTPVHIEQRPGEPFARILGHVGDWKGCNRSFKHVCVPPPKSRTNYTEFHTAGHVRTPDGLLRVGKVVMGEGHPDASVPARIARAYYDATSKEVAHVRGYEDQFGPYINGVLAPGVTPEEATTLLASPVSGDWKNHEMIAVLAVNVGGHPIRTQATFDANGQPRNMVAAGRWWPDEADDLEDAHEVLWAAEFALAQEVLS